VHIKYKYDIGISYASEQKEYVKQLADSLDKAGLKYFVDFNEPERLWGTYIPEELRKIYVEESRIILVILSSEYTEKAYTKFESRIACERNLSDDSFLIIKTDDVTLPWLNSTYGFMNSSDHSVDEIANFLKKKLQALKKK
jgi:hypothetical protein